MNDAVLTGYLKTNFNDVKALFAAQGTTSGADLAYITSTKDSAGRIISVHINRAATQASDTGSIDLAAGGATETLTVTQGASTANMAIIAGMTFRISSTRSIRNSAPSTLKHFPAASS